MLEEIRYRLEYVCIVPGGGWSEVPTIREFQREDQARARHRELLDHSHFKDVKLYVAAINWKEMKGAKKTSTAPRLRRSPAQVRGLDRPRA